MADFTPNFDGFFRNEIKTIKQSIEDNHMDYDVEVGEMHYGKVTYPAVNVLPEDTSYNSGEEYGESVLIDIIFAKNMNCDFDEDYLEFINQVESICQTVYDNLMSETESNPRVDRISYAVGLTDKNKHLDIITIEMMYDKFPDGG